jgi:hypothetical protein
MSDAQTLAAAFQAAKAAGDDVNARKFAEALVALQGAQEPQRETTWKDPARAALQGATFGFADEIGSAVAAIPASIATGTSPVSVYEDMQRQVSDEQKSYAEANPGTALGLEVLGGLLTGGATGVKALPSLLGKLSKPAATSLLGAVQGGIYGAGTADQGERMGGAGFGAATGAALAPVAGALLEKGGNAVGALAQWAARKLADTPKDQAERAIRVIAEREGLNADEVIAAYQRLGQPAVLADVGENFRIGARAAADELGPFKAQARGLLETRQMGAADRMANSVQNTLGANADDYLTTIQRIEQERGAQAEPLYTKAWQEGNAELSAMRDAFNIQNPNAGAWDWLRSVLGDRPSLESAIRSGVKSAKDRGDDPGDNLMRILDAAKRGIDSKIEKARARGAKSDVRDMTILKNDLLNFLDADVSPSYAQARSTFAGKSELLDAAKQGKEFFSLDPDELAAVVQGMGASEKDLFRMGVVKAIVAKLDDTELTRDPSRLINKKSTQKKLGLVFDSPADAEKFIRSAIAEREFARTRQIVTGGSMTSTNIKAGEGLNDAIQPDSFAAFASGDPLGMAAATIKALAGKQALTPEVLNEMGRLLMAQGVPENEIRRILTQPPMARYAGLLGQTYPNAARGAVAPASVGLLQ